MEFVTVFFYIIDIVLRIRNYRMLIKTSGTMPFSSNEYERKLNEDREEFLKRLKFIWIEIICSMVGTIPFSYVFYLT